ncbi:MAG TPA: hypothetical protein ENI33_06825 [Thermoplasmatales archaeon]|nr:hypothetical protein [Thermoplasmatales archaeon]
MRRIALILIFLIPTSSAFNVVVSIPDFAPIVKEIAGNYANISVILPAGSDPHSFSITKDTINKIKNADIIILANSDLLSYERNIKENYNKNYLDFSDYEKYGVILLDFGNFKNNPHGYWMYVNNTIAIAKAITHALNKMEENVSFNDSLNKFEKKIREAEAVLINIAKENGIYGKKAIACVPGVCYIAKNMGVETDEILFYEGVSSADIQKLSSLKEKLKSGKYFTIIVPEFMKYSKGDEIAKQLAHDANSSITYVKFATGDESYFNLFYYNAISIISSGNKKNFQEKYDLGLIFLTILISIIALIEGLIIYRYRRLK